ncbi:MBL fold metallo-hydrolase [Roseomonas elaeocarpi]|uniref:MBL fold metallo-hydrolase n=1 Tax=Roseomonas elaeocarpi TaxID=907779 RepID=A0ABV6JVF0_9PROT
MSKPSPTPRPGLSMPADRDGEAARPARREAAAPRSDDAPPAFRREDHARPGVAEDVAPGIRRLLCPNPGPLTFTGTNTWLLGQSEVTLIDPGPDLPEHREAILGAAGAGRIVRILVTHTHLDHSAGAPALQRLTGAPVSGFGAHGPLVGPGADTRFRPDVVLPDEATVPTEAGLLRALHTPGHCPTHLCFALEGTGILFSGDHVMAWSTTAVTPPDGSMADYMRSLARIAARDDRLLLPGHGPVLEEPAPFLAALRRHREEREAAILRALDGAAPMTAAELVPLIYGVALDPRLAAGAAGSVLAHLIKLAGEGRITASPEGYRRR